MLVDRRKAVRGIGFVAADQPFSHFFSAEGGYERGVACLSGAVSDELGLR
jgi:hypothetical protein